MHVNIHMIKYINNHIKVGIIILSAWDSVNFASLSCLYDLGNDLSLQSK